MNEEDLKPKMPNGLQLAARLPQYALSVRFIPA